MVFFFAGLAMVVIALLAFTTRSYRTLSAEYAGAQESVPVAADPSPPTGPVPQPGT